MLTTSGIISNKRSIETTQDHSRFEVFDSVSWMLDSILPATYTQPQIPGSRVLPPMETDTSLVEQSFGPPISSSSSERTKHKRKLDLTKCDRCRFDKQKCLPTTRTWPTKCNRCEKKGFSCSEPRKIQRPSKFTALDSQPCSSSYEEQQNDDLVEKWAFLVSYRQLLLAALDRIHDVEQKMMQNFWPKHSQIRPRGAHSEEQARLYAFIELVGVKISDMKEKISIIPSLSNNSRRCVLNAMDSPVSSRPPRISDCLFCCLNTRRAVEDCERQDLVCQGFSLRIWRLPTFGGYRCEFDHRNEIQSELRNLYTTAISITDKTVEILAVEGRECDSAKFAPPAGILFPDEIIGYFILYENKDYDMVYLDRTAAHRWLDAVSRAVGTRLFEGHLSLAISIGGLDIDQQDFLGRTLLAIACQMAWTRAVRYLLIKGANPNLPTVHGSLPIHHAAANGSVDICELLLAHVAEFDLDHTDVSGLSAYDYASKRQDQRVMDLLDQCRTEEGRDESEKVSALSEKSRDVHLVSADYYSRSMSALQTAEDLQTHRHPGQSKTSLLPCSDTTTRSIDNGEVIMTAPNLVHEGTGEGLISAELTDPEVTLVAVFHALKDIFSFLATSKERYLVFHLSTVLDSVLKTLDEISTETCVHSESYPSEGSFGNALLVLYKLAVENDFFSDKRRACAFSRATVQKVIAFAMDYVESGLGYTFGEAKRGEIINTIGLAWLGESPSAQRVQRMINRIYPGLVLVSRPIRVMGRNQQPFESLSTYISTIVEQA